MFPWAQDLRADPCAAYPLLLLVLHQSWLQPPRRPMCWALLGSAFYLMTTMIGSDEIHQFGFIVDTISSSQVRAMCYCDHQDAIRCVYYYCCPFPAQRMGSLWWAVGISVPTVIIIILSSHTSNGKLLCSLWMLSTMEEACVLLCFYRIYLQCVIWVFCMDIWVWMESLYTLRSHLGVLSRHSITVQINSNESRWNVFTPEWFDRNPLLPRKVQEALFGWMSCVSFYCLCSGWGNCSKRLRNRA